MFIFFSAFLDTDKKEDVRKCRSNTPSRSEELLTCFGGSSFQIPSNGGHIWTALAVIKRRTEQKEKPRQGHRGLIKKVAKLQSVTGRETRIERDRSCACVTPENCNIPPSPNLVG